MEKLTGLEASKPESSRISKAYFLWHTKIPYVDLAISRPKKYFKGSRSFKQNLSFKRIMNSETAFMSFLAIATSSTNTKRTM
jgi:hypothetical protein